MKTILATVGAALAAISLGAAEATSENVEKKVAEATAEAAENAAQMEEKEDSIFEAEFSFDFFSAYVWRNAVFNDRMVMQPCISGDFTMLDPFWFGFYIWQNYDITDRRQEAIRTGLTETDYNLHAGVTAWENEEETMSLGFEIGHEWFDNCRYRSAYRHDYHSTRELYLKAMYDNEFVNVYGQISWLYDDICETDRGFNYELGFNREFEITDTLTFGADWNVSWADKNYLSFLYTGTYSAIDDDYTDKPSAGFAGTTIKCYLSWAITDWLSLVGTIAYTGVLNSDLRDSFDEQGGDAWWDGDRYPRDLLWGGFSLKASF